MIGELISGGLKLLGGFLDRDAAQDRANADWERNAALQREFAQHGIRWRVSDAKAAGLHPLAALGAQVSSGAPIATGDVPGISDSLAGMGASVERAMNATRTPEERSDAYTSKLRQLQLTRGELENQLLMSQIKRLQVQTNPALPTAKSTDQGDAPPAPEHTGLRTGDGSTLSTDPTVSDAQKFEDRYGESSDVTWGPYIQWRDWRYRRNYGFNSFPTPDADQRAAALSNWRRYNRGDWFTSKRYRD